MYKYSIYYKDCIYLSRLKNGHAVTNGNTTHITRVSIRDKLLIKEVNSKFNVSFIMLTFITFFYKTRNLTNNHKTFSKLKIRD